MAVSERDVQQLAALARLGLDPERIPHLAAELNGILAHLAVLQRVHETAGPAAGIGAGGMPLRADEGDPYPLAHPVASLAPSVRDGFLLVPRLASHGGEEGSA